MIFVDADACPVALREMLVRTAERAQIAVLFVANHFVDIGKGKHTQFLQVQKGFDVADHAIVSRCQVGDLVITQDIPLAAEVIEKGAQAIGLRGQVHTADNIRARLTMRDFMETMRASGEQTKGPAPLSNRDKQLFAAALDRYVAQWQAKQARSSAQKSL